MYWSLWKERIDFGRSEKSGLIYNRCSKWPPSILMQALMRFSKFNWTFSITSSSIFQITYRNLVSKSSTSSGSVFGKRSTFLRKFSQNVRLDNLLVVNIARVCNEMRATFFLVCSKGRCQSRFVSEFFVWLEPIDDWLHCRSASYIYTIRGWPLSRVSRAAIRRGRRGGGNRDTPRIV